MAPARTGSRMAPLSRIVRLFGAGSQDRREAAIQDDAPKDAL